MKSVGGVSGFWNEQLVFFKGAQLPNCDSLTSKGALFREHFPETVRLQFGRFSNPISEPSSTLKKERGEKIRY